MKLDELFAPGPEGFLNDQDGPSRLRRFVCAMNEGLELEPPPPPPPAAKATPEATEDTAADNEEFQGADAWKAEAVRKWRGLWSGDVDSLQAVFNVAPPEQLAAFDRATTGANPWSTFYEFRLDAALMGEPPEDENLFEKCVLNDQLNYLGTALPEVFSGLVGIGSLGNGDTYHFELTPAEGEKHAIYFFDHETHRFEGGFAVDLESLVYLAALCKATSEEYVSAEVAATGYKALHEKVDPSWHFSMDERDEDFVPWEKGRGPSQPMFMFWRSYWIYYLFRHDGHVGVEDLGNRFAQKLNAVLPPERVPARMENAARSAPTALYATWRAYLFDEPELDRYMEISRAHAARLVRDAARLIDELRDGRESLGRIEDWPDVLKRFRALDLDPRRAEARKKEEEEQAAATDRARTAVRAELGGLFEDAELAFVAERLARPELHGAILHTLLKQPARAKAKRGFDYLFGQGYSRDGSLYRHEERDACRYIAAHSDATLLLLLLGAMMNGGGGDEDEPMLAGTHLWQTLMAAPDRIPPEGRAALNAKIEGLVLENPSWLEHSLVRLAGRIGDAAAIPALRAVLEKIPAEGGFETSLHFDDFVGYIAEAIRLIGDGAAAPELTPFAQSASLRMRDARVESALAIACTSASDFTDTMASRAIEFVSQINDGGENAKALFSIAKAKPSFESALGAKPSAASKPSVKLAQSILSQDESAVATHLKEVFTSRAYDDKYTMERRRMGLLACKVFGLKPDVEDLRAACGLDPELDEELAALGGFEPPRRITFFDAKDMDTEQLIEVLQDESVFGRSQAAHAARGEESARGALEAALRSIDAKGKLPDDTRYLLKEAAHSLVELPEAESTVALFDALLRDPSRDIKDPVLRHLPPWSGLKGGMEFVRDQKWGWQEGAATKWLEEHG